MFKCSTCNREFKSYKGLQNHSSRTHKINADQLYVDFYLNGEWPVCKCGCKSLLNRYGGKFGEYIKGHIARVNGGFYTNEGVKKSTETRRQQYASGEREQWNKGKVMTEEWRKAYRENVWDNDERNKKISIARKEIRAKELGYTSWQDWYDQQPERKQYYYDVWRLTEEVVHLIPNYDPELRGIAGKEGAYQVDHIVPISKGFADNMPPEEIARPENLRFIPWKDNLIKGAKG